MIFYIFKSVACSLIFIAVYYCFLEREKMLVFNRFYLLATILLSGIIPLITIEFKSDFYLTQAIPSNPLPIDLSPETISSVETATSPVSLILLLAYITITALLLIRFIKNLLSLISLKRNNKINYIKDAPVVILDEPAVPHTFFNCIFISKIDLTNGHILTHELTHFRQWHSLDIVFIEFVQCISWFNPALTLYKKAIRLNHEFLADDSVIKAHKNVPHYQSLLLSTLTRLKTNALASSFNYSITKKRFTMMTILPSKKRAATKVLITTLVLCATIAIFCSKVYSQEVTDKSTADSYVIFKDGKWQNQTLTINPGPADGMSALMKSLQRELRYPSSAKISGTEGDVVVVFDIDENGKLKNCSVVKKLLPDCEAEVIMALKNADIDWNPAVLNGKSYPSRFVIPVSFRLEPTQLTNSYDLSTVFARPIPQVVIVTSRP